jgi:hypothetical protein
VGVAPARPQLPLPGARSERSASPPVSRCLPLGRSPGVGSRGLPGFVRSGEDVSVRWIMSYWDEEDVTFFFEVGDDGWVVRQVELAGQDQRPISAAALAEWIDASEAGGVEAYEARFGRVAESPIGDWGEGFPQVDLSLVEYEEVWRGARLFLDDDST